MILRTLLLLICLLLANPAHAVINIYVDTDATGAEDGTSWTDAYTSLADAEAENLDLVTAADSCIIWCRASNGTADALTSPTGLTVSGWTTSATYDLTITVPESDQHAGVWDTDVYRLTANGSAATPLLIDNAYVAVVGLQIGADYDGTSGTDYQFGMRLLSSADYVEVSQCIIRKYNVGNQSGIYWHDMATGATLYLINNAIYDFNYGLYCNQRYTTVTAAGAIYHNTIIDSGTQGAYIRYNTGNASGLSIKNNIVQGSGTADYALVNPGSTGNNISSDTSSPDTAFRSITLTFADADNDDYRLASTDTDAIDAGADLSADGIYAVGVDIAGTSRPQGDDYDIGAFEYTAGSTPVPLNIQLLFF